MARAEPAPARGFYSEDRLLGGRVRLRQPVSGPRAAIDAVLLAAAVPAREGERVLDLGTGAGAASLCLAARVARVTLTGLEIQPAAATLARGNADLNGVADRFEVVVGDVAHPPADLRAGGFDHVMANPPHHAAGRATAPADPALAAARIEATAGAGLGDWIACGFRLVRNGGTVTIIHRADRLDDLLHELRGRRGGARGGIVVFPLWPRAGQAAKRVVVRARKGGGAPLRLASGLVLHGEGGSYTEAAEAVLRHAAPLDLLATPQVPPT